MLLRRRFPSTAPIQTPSAECISCGCMSLCVRYIFLFSFLSESAFFSIYTCTSSMEMILSTIIIIETNLYLYGEEEVDDV